MNIRSLLILLLPLALSALACSENQQPLQEDPQITLEATPPLVPIDLPVQIQALDGSGFLDGHTLFLSTAFLLPDGSHLKPTWYRDKHPNTTSMMTHAGTPSTVYRLQAGEIIREDVLLGKEYFNLQWFVLDNEIVLVNLFTEKIPYVDPMDIADPQAHPKHKRFEEIGAEYDKKLDKIVQENNLTFDPGWGWRDPDGNLVDERLFAELQDPWITWEQEVSTHPFGSFSFERRSDVLEVNIQHTVTYQDSNGKQRKLLFVKILRNLTRPHITFPRPLLP